MGYRLMVTSEHVEVSESAPRVQEKISVGDLPNTRGANGNYADTRSLELGFDRTRELDDLQARQIHARETAIKGGPQERIDFLLNEVLIRTPDVSHMISTIEHLLDHAEMYPNPGGIRVIAPGGCGKNALIRYLLRKHGPNSSGRTFSRPIVHVEFHERVLPGAIMRLLLESLGTVYKNYQKNSELEENLFEAMQACGTKGIIFNEVQHMLYVTQRHHRALGRVSGESGDWLKRFIDSCKRPVFLFGVPGWDEVFIQDPQLSTRIPHRYEFAEFQFDSIFIGVLRALDQAIPMPEPAGLDGKDMAGDIYTVTRGNWRLLIHLLRDAILVASRAGIPRIERPDLSWAYQLQFGPRSNPFGPPRAS